MPISQKRELDDRFQESCHMGGIYLSFQAPIEAAGGPCDEGFSDMAGAAGD